MLINTSEFRLVHHSVTQTTSWAVSAGHSRHHRCQRRLSSRASSGVGSAPLLGQECSTGAPALLLYGGPCTTCGTAHHLHPSPAAHAAAAQLAALLDQHQRIDLDAGAAAARRPELSTAYLWTLGPGRMLGVLLCECPATGETRVLRAFSGQMSGHWDVPGWAGPVAGVTSAGALYCDFRRLTEALGARLTQLQCVLGGGGGGGGRGRGVLDAPAAATAVPPQEDLIPAEEAACTGVATALPPPPPQLPQPLPPPLHAPNRQQQRQQQRARRHAPASPSAVAAAVVASGGGTGGAAAAVAAAEVLRVVERRRALSRHLMHTVQCSYRTWDVGGRPLELLQVHNAWRRQDQPGSSASTLPFPAGTGDCCAPKLLHQAALCGLRPVSLVEFWYGSPPSSNTPQAAHRGQRTGADSAPVRASAGHGGGSGEANLPLVVAATAVTPPTRRHLACYGACAKCQAVLGTMLCGQDAGPVFCPPVQFRG